MQGSNQAKGWIVDDFQLSCLTAGFGALAGEPDAYESAHVGQGLLLDEPVVDGSAPVAMPGLAAMHALGAAAPGEDALALACKLVEAMGVKVKFDFFSHSSGVQRGYVKCSNDSHVACWRYRQTNQFHNRKRLVAYLISWSLLGPCVDRATHVGDFEPPAEAVDEVEASLNDV